MAFESVRGYFQLASGLGELSRARAMEAAQGLLSLPGVGIATGKVAGQVGALAEELLAAATTNREHLTTLVRSEVDAAVTRLGLVPAEKLQESRAEAARLRAEIAELRSGSAAKATAVKKSAVAKSTPRKSAVAKSTPRKSAARKAAPTKTAARKASASKSSASRTSAAQTATSGASATNPTTARRSAVTTRRKPTGT